MQIHRYTVYYDSHPTTHTHAHICLYARAGQLLYRNNGVLTPQPHTHTRTHTYIQTFPLPLHHARVTLFCISLPFSLSFAQIIDYKFSSYLCCYYARVSNMAVNQKSNRTTVLNLFIQLFICFQYTYSCLRYSHFYIFHFALADCVITVTFLSILLPPRVRTCFNVSLLSLFFFQPHTHTYKL